MKNAYADAVVVGKIKEVKREGNAAVHNVEIEKHYSGLENMDLVKIYTDQVTSCAFSMEENQTYLIFININQKNGFVSTSYCSGTKKLESAEKEIGFMESLKDAEDGKGVLVGSVVEHDMKNKFTVKPWKPKEINKVYLESESGEKFETEIGNDGWYSFSNLMGGWYETKIFVPERLITSAEENDDEYIRKEGFREIISRIKVPGSGCEARRYYSVVPNGIISGKVFDSNNVPLAKIPVNIYRFDDEDEMPEQNYKVWTDDLGNYVAKGMPSGRYLIGVGIGHDLYMNSHFDGYLPTFYPNTTSRKSAIFFNLDEAEFLKGKNLNLPPKLLKRKIKGQVLSKNNQPISNAKFSAFARRDGVARGDWTDEKQVNNDGTFEFGAYAETEYILLFWTENKDGKRESSSECINIKKNGNIEPIEIRLKAGSSNCRVKN